MWGAGEPPRPKASSLGETSPPAHADLGHNYTPGVHTRGPVTSQGEAPQGEAPQGEAPQGEAAQKPRSFLLAQPKSQSLLSCGSVPCGLCVACRAAMWFRDGALLRRCVLCVLSVCVCLETNANWGYCEFRKCVCGDGLCELRGSLCGVASTDASSTCENTCSRRRQLHRAVMANICV